ncbi:hypothetical protein [Neptunicella marina]|uniref:DUF4386 family protein n=1 Tax=Neptunicella marina TaxID=2125989 RepID=A0A8J6J0J8_9ALTE|nr:hypothetical protein [Neptunicella marina]MBC3767742.1 hypothetical protein [Neptunicella marina]
MLQTLSRLIAASSAINAICYLFGFIVLFVFFADLPPDVLMQLPALKLHNQMYQWWHFVIYIVFGLSLLTLVLALHHTFNQKPSLLVQVSTILGVFWAGLVITSGLLANTGLTAALNLLDKSPTEANQLWLIIETIKQALGGGTEIIGGLWMLLVTTLARKHPDWDPGLLITGYLVGVSGVLTFIPGLAFLGAVFGLLQIIWFLHLSIKFALVKKAPEGAL